MNKNKLIKMLLIGITIALLIYSSIMTYYHIKGRILRQERNDKIEKQLKEYDNPPDVFK